MFNEITWKQGEKQVQKYMKKLGYKIKYTNFFCVGVELDIVAILPKKVQFKQLKKEYKEKIKNAKNFKNNRIYYQNFKNLKKNIMDLVIICEVKARTSDEFGEGYLAVGTAKQKNIIRGAKYILKLNEFKGMQVRFDVASVDSGKITYFENAFTC